MKSAQRTLSCDAQRGNGNIPRGGILDCMKAELKNSLPIQMDEKAPGRTISRREAGKRLLAGMAMGTTVPLITAGHPIWKHFENAELLERAERAAGNDKPAFLKREQDLALVAGWETILHGLAEAGGAKLV